MTALVKRVVDGWSDRRLSRAARAMATSAWWICVPEWQQPAAVAGEVGR